MRLGPLYRPNVTLRELTDAYVEQYDAAPSTVAWLSDNMRPALKRSATSRSASCGSTRSRRGGRALPEGKRYRVASRAAAGARSAAVRWKWIEDNPAALVKNPEPQAGRDPSVRVVGGDRRDRRRARRGRRARWSMFLCGTGVRPGGGVRRRVARRRPRAAGVHGAARVREGPAEGLRARRPARGARCRCARAWSTALERCSGSARGILFPAPRGRADRHQQLAQPRLDAGARGGGRRAPADLRPAPHVRDVEPGGRASTSSRWPGGWARA